MTYQELENLYQHPNIRVALAVIRDAEHYRGEADPYTVAGGGKVRLKSLDNAQFPRWGFREKNGKANTSTASGAYQFMPNTWGGLVKQYGFKDFSRYNQDLGAIALLAEKGSIKDILDGNIYAGLHKARKVWASFPGAGYNQKERTPEFMMNSIRKHSASTPDSQVKLETPVKSVPNEVASQYYIDQTISDPTSPPSIPPPETASQNLTPSNLDQWASLYKIAPSGVEVGDISPTGNGLLANEFGIQSGIKEDDFDESLYN